MMLHPQLESWLPLIDRGKKLLFPIVLKITIVLRVSLCVCVYDASIKIFFQRALYTILTIPWKLLRDTICC